MSTHCVIQVAHEHVDRVMTVSEELQSQLDDVMRVNRQHEHTIRYKEEEITRLSLRERDLEERLEQAYQVRDNENDNSRKEKQQLNQLNESALDATREEAARAKIAAFDERAAEVKARTLTSPDPWPSSQTPCVLFE